MRKLPPLKIGGKTRKVEKRESPERLPQADMRAEQPEEMKLRPEHSEYKREDVSEPGEERRGREREEEPEEPESEPEPALGSVMAKSIRAGIQDESKIDMQDSAVRQCFPFGERFRERCCYFLTCCCATAHRSTSDFFLNSCKPSFSFPKEHYRNKVVQLGINCTGLLELDDKVIHPFIRIHIVDMITGKYVAKRNPSKPSVSNRETAAVINYENLAPSCSEIELNFIPPFATSYCDFRVLGENRAQYYQKFVLNVEPDVVFNDNVVIIFELLDYSLTLIQQNDPILRNNLYPVAWAYLRPHGEAWTHSSTTRLQFFRYKFQMSEGFLKNEFVDVRTPLVFYDFNWPSHTEYSSFLEIDLSFIKKPLRADVNRPSLNPLEREVSSRKIESDFTGDDVDRTRPAEGEKETTREKKLREKLISWERGFGQPCLIPNELLYKFRSEAMGCFTVKFSNNGKYLAAACSESDKKCLIKIFNIEFGELSAVIGIHQGVVHEFKWSNDDAILVSVGSDSMAKLWDMRDIEGRTGGATDYYENEKKFLIGCLQHPSYVYSAEYLPDYANKLRPRPVVATACFDGKVRVWEIALDEEETRGMQAFCRSEVLLEQAETDPSERTHYLLTHNFPTSLVFDDTGRLYIGDSRGWVHVWDVIAREDKVTITEIKIINEKEIEGDPVNRLLLEPVEKRRLLIHSRDNCIRLLEHSTKRPKGVSLRYFGLSSAKQHKIKSCISPDGQYILAGSEDGVPHMWNYATAIEYSTKMYECSFMGSITDVDWNNVYNINVMCGYGDSFPILIYVYRREQNSLLAYNLGQIELKQDKMKIYDDKADPDLRRKTVLNEIGNQLL